MKSSDKVSSGGKTKTLILKDSRGFIPFEGMDNIYTYFLSYSVFARGLRKFCWKMKSGFIPSFFYGKWKKQLKDADLVIMFDCGARDFGAVAKYIKSVNPSIRIVFWYWNPVESGCAVPKKDYIDEIWTYNRFDARKYGFKYSPQFYHKNLIIRKDNINADLIFLGKDKGREKTLGLLKKSATEQGLICDFVVVKTKQDQIKYKDYLKRVAGSKCIVDLVPNQSCGLTLRPLEALFFGKKLITNNEDIINYDFYTKENIFIIGKDDMKKLADFINSPVKYANKKILNYYSYEGWLSRIENDESAKI